MKRLLASVMHWAGRVSGFFGGLALLGAWTAGENGMVLGFSQQRLYNDAITLTLIGISAFVCAILYLQEEKF